MADEVLRGNFTPKKKVVVERDAEDTLESRFEAEALKRLGGSIAFVSKKKVIWGPEASEDPSGPVHE